MKKRYPISLIIWLLVLISVGVNFCTGDQTARYIANQDKKQLFLAEAKEDVSVLTSCLHPSYRCRGANPEFIIPSKDISKIIPSAQCANPAQETNPLSQENK
ncbi:MAG: hypothetical protein Q7S30_01055 [Candidatus Omnitrophota bacterium]|nr:hypothetical protein [Candidatus Omnitrophota bacterium]